MSEALFPASDEADGGVWTPVADVMSGLMVVFLLIAVAFSAQADPDVSAEEAFRHVQETVSGAVEAEVAPHLEVWGAELDSSGLAVRFVDDDTLFEVGDAALTPSYARTLDRVVPRLVALVENEGFRRYVQEIRIEGHTSSEWNGGVTGEGAYLLNMELSQDRTRSVLAHVLAHDAVRSSAHREWVRQHLTANGLSSARPILRGGAEDPAASRRVELRFQVSWEPGAVEHARRSLDTPS